MNDIITDIKTLELETIKNLKNSKANNTVRAYEADFKDFKTETKIFVNGNWLGIHKESISLLKKLRHYKRIGKINPFVSISFDYILNEIKIYTDSGRCCRPLYIVDNNKLRITHNHVDRLKRKIINWNNLISGVSGNKVFFGIFFLLSSSYDHFPPIGLLFSSIRIFILVLIF